MTFKNPLKHTFYCKLYRIFKGCIFSNRAQFTIHFSSKKRSSCIFFRMLKYVIVECRNLELANNPLLFFQMTNGAVFNGSLSYNQGCVSITFSIIN